MVVENELRKLSSRSDIIRLGALPGENSVRIRQPLMPPAPALPRATLYPLSVPLSADRKQC